MPLGWRLAGELDVEGLRSAIMQVMRRQEALRTSFALEEEEVVQLVHEEAPLPFKFIDLSALPDAKELAQRELQRDAAAPFDLSQPPLFRALLLKVAAREFLLRR